jgi:hypothetical protein
VALFRATTVQCFSKIGVMHMFMETRCICSYSMVFMMHVSTTRLPTHELVVERTITGWEEVCAASRILTTKIPCALLVAIMWLHRTWLPRFRHGTFTYGITTSPIIIEISTSREVSMRMHVSSPKVPKCTCYAIACSRRDMFIYIFIFQKVVSKTMRDNLMIESSK